MPTFDAMEPDPNPSVEAITWVIDTSALSAVEVWDRGFLIEHRHRVVDVRGGDGHSGMGAVFIVRDTAAPESAPPLAMKTIQRRHAKHLGYARRFIREARTWMLLGFHPNIVQAHRLDIVRALPCLFTEFVPSDAAGRHTVAQYLRDDALPMEQALDWAIQCCDGMTHAAAAYPGLVHRDLKPDNLLVTPDGVLKITDFGLVRGLDADDGSLAGLGRVQGLPADAGLTEAGTIFGTPAYMAPEQFARAGTVDVTADIYAMGCCLFEMLTGSPPFLVRADSTAERVLKLRRKHLEEAPPRLEDRIPNCPQALNAILARCLAKDPRERWPDFAALREALADVLKGALHRTVRTLPRTHATPRQIADQMRSLALLDGYDRAIRLRSLREEQDEKPYAFHLALASYFRSQADPAEEQRQLQKALWARHEEAGFEAVRRLAELYLASGRHDTARGILDEFLAAHPTCQDPVLEPWVRVRCAQGQTGEALALLDTLPDSLRIQTLRAEIAQANDDLPTLTRTLNTMVEQCLHRIAAHAAQVTPGSHIAFGSPGDADILVDVMDILGTGVDVQVLSVADEAIWPDLSGYPDFAPDMAWLSHALGWLAAIPGALSPAQRDAYREAAAVLGYPHRLARHLEREDQWFWNLEAARNAQRPSA